MAISSKAWQCLENEKIRHSFLENLASNTAGQDYFNALIVDLMFIPAMRARMLSDFRKPERSENLVNAVGRFFQAIST